MITKRSVACCVFVRCCLDSYYCMSMFQFYSQFSGQMTAENFELKDKALELLCHIQKGAAKDVIIGQPFLVTTQLVKYKSRTLNVSE